MACEPPEKSGRPITHWTHAERTDEVLKRQIVSSISVSTVGQYLRTAALQPHPRKMWIHTTEKDPATFPRQVQDVCETYPAAVARHETEGGAPSGSTVCIDEMTGLQALERAAPDKPTRAGQVAKQEFEYVRHGTTTLIGSWDVVAGAMFSETISPTRTEADFVAHVEQTVASAPDVPWVIVLDCLNVHWSASLVEWIAQRCEPNRPLGKKGVSGVLHHQATRREFLSDPSHRIRFVFLPKHSSWRNQVEVIFVIVMRKVMRRGNFTSVADLEEKLRMFLKYFNITMAHPFDWTYTGRPTTPRSPCTFCPPHRRQPRPSKLTLAKLAL